MSADYVSCLTKLKFIIVVSRHWGVDPATYSHFVVPFLMDKVLESIRLSMIRFHPKDQLEWTIDLFKEVWDGALLFWKMRIHGNLLRDAELELQWEKL